MRKIEEARLKAVAEAIKHVSDGQVVGLGSGSTVMLIIAELAKHHPKIKVVPASSQTLLEAVRHGLNVAYLDVYPRPDIYLDSFDQVDGIGNMIKGGGGAHLREKVLCHAAEETVFVGDYGKRTAVLDKPVPLEVLPFALPYVMNRMKELGGRPALRTSQGKNGPVVSDNGNYIVDVDFGAIEDAKSMEMRLRTIPGIIENGLFVNAADRIIIGEENGDVTTQNYRRTRV